MHSGTLNTLALQRKCKGLAKTIYIYGVNTVYKRCIYGIYTVYVRYSWLGTSPNVRTCTVCVYLYIGILYIYGWFWPTLYTYLHSNVPALLNRCAL